MPWVGNGPLWYSKDFPMKNEDCHNYWWSYLLFVNNFVPGGKGVKVIYNFKLNFNLKKIYLFDFIVYGLFVVRFK